MEEKLSQMEQLQDSFEQSPKDQVSLCWGGGDFFSVHLFALLVDFSMSPLVACGNPSTHMGLNRVQGIGPWIWHVLRSLTEVCCFYTTCQALPIVCSNLICVCT